MSHHNHTSFFKRFAMALAVTVTFTGASQAGVLDFSDEETHQTNQTDQRNASDRVQRNDYNVTFAPRTVMDADAIIELLQSAHSGAWAERVDAGAYLHVLGDVNGTAELAYSAINAFENGSVLLNSTIDKRPGDTFTVTDAGDSSATVDQTQGNKSSNSYEKQDTSSVDVSTQ